MELRDQGRLKRNNDVYFGPCEGYLTAFEEVLENSKREEEAMNGYSRVMFTIIIIVYGQTTGKTFLTLIHSLNIS